MLSMWPLHAFAFCEFEGLPGLLAVHLDSGCSATDSRVSLLVSLSFPGLHNTKCTAFFKPLLYGMVGTGNNKGTFVTSTLDVLVISSAIMRRLS